MDKLNIQLDAQEFVKAANDATIALAGFQAQVKSFVASSPKGQVQSQMAALQTSAVDMVQKVSAALGQVDGAIKQAAQQMESSAKSAGKRTAGALGDGLKEGGERTLGLVRQLRQAVQNEYEQMVIAGQRLSTDQLRTYRMRGATLTPDHSEEVKSMMGASSVLAMRKRLVKEEEAVEAARAEMLARAGKGLAALQQKLGQERVTQEESNARTLFRVMRAVTKQEEAELAERQRVAERAAAALAKFREKEAARISSLRAASAGNVDPRTLLGLPPLETGRSAAASAGVFREADKLAESHKKLADHSREVHSALRGIAAAGGQLFLTYGSLIPLATAFAAASAVRDSIKTYKDLEYQLKMVQAVADGAVVPLDEMRARVGDISKEIGVLPVEAAKGLRILAQAGLDTTQAMQALPDILRLSVAGEIDLAQAAETVAGSMNAFGLGIAGTGRIVDVFHKTAAESATSVAKISESMKQASTIAERYKVSVEDVGVALIALAKRNITGSSAGTAITQMFEELATPRGEGRKVASMLGITLFDPMKHDTKKFFEEFVPQLREKLKQFDPESQTFIMNRLTNNRGAKALSAILGLTDEEIAKFKKNLEDATGATARAVADINDSVQGDLNKLKATFSTVLEGAGKGGADSFRDALQSLKTTLESKELQAALGEMVKGVAAIGQVVAWVIEKWAAWEQYRKLLPMWMDPLGAIGRQLKIVQDHLSDSAPVDRAIAGVDRTVAKEKEYQAALADTIAKLREKLGLQGEAKKAESGDLKQEILNQQQRLREAQDAFNAAMAKGKPALLHGADTAEQRAARRRLAQEEANYARMLAAEVREANAKAESEAMQQEAARLRALEARKQREAREKLAGPKGEKRFEMPGPGAAGEANSAYTELKKKFDLEANARKQAFSTEEEDFRHREAMLKASYARGASDFREYQAQLEEIHGAAVLRRMAEIEAEQKAIEEAAPRVKAALQKASDAGSKIDQENANNFLTSLAQRSQALQLEMTKLQNREQERRAEAFAKALEPARELARTAEEELAAQKLNVEQEIEKLSLRGRLGELSEKERFVQEQVLKVTNSQVDAIAKKERELKKLLDSGVFDDLSGPETLKAFNAILAAIQKAKEDLAESKKRIGEVAGEVFEEKRIENFSNDISKALVDGMMNAGRDGGKTLRKQLVDALKKPIVVEVQTALQSVTSGLVKSIFRGGAGDAGGAGNAGGSFLGDLGSILFPKGLPSFFPKDFSLFGMGGSQLGLLGQVAGAGALVGRMLGSLLGLKGDQVTAATIGGSLLGGLPGALLGKLVSPGGGPKTESGYGLGVPTRGDPTAAREIVATVQQLYREAAGTYAKDLKLGFFSATDPKGTAKTQLAVEAAIDGKSIYSREKRTGGIENVERGEGNLGNAITEEVARVLVAALKEANPGGEFGEYLNKVDFSGMDAEAIKRTTDTLVTAGKLQQELQLASLPPLERIAEMRRRELEAMDPLVASLTKQLREKQQVANYEQRLFELTATDREKLDQARALEFAALEPAAQAIAQLVWAREDELAAIDKQKAADQEHANLRERLLALIDPIELKRVQRERELAEAMDEASRAILRKIYAAEDERDAASKAAEATKKAAEGFANAGDIAFESSRKAIEAWQEQQKELERIRNLGKGIADWLKTLRAERAGTAKPEDRLREARNSYLDDLRKARDGDADAYARLTQSAQAYIDAMKGWAGDGSDTQALIDQIMSEMGGLPAVKAYQAQTVEELRKIRKFLMGDDGNPLFFGDRDEYDEYWLKKIEDLFGKIEPKWEEWKPAPTNPGLPGVPEAINNMSEKLDRMTVVMAAGAQQQVEATKKVADNTASLNNDALFAMSAAPL